jgi:hypothetical protein
MKAKITFRIQDGKRSLFEKAYHFMHCFKKQVAVDQFTTT